MQTVEESEAARHHAFDNTIPKTRTVIIPKPKKLIKRLFSSQLELFFLCLIKDN
jgi:hypothetical protein